MRLTEDRCGIQTHRLLAGWDFLGCEAMKTDLTLRFRLATKCRLLSTCSPNLSTRAGKSPESPARLSTPPETNATPQAGTILSTCSETGVQVSTGFCPGGTVLGASSAKVDLRVLEWRRSAVLTALR